MKLSIFILAMINYCFSYIPFPSDSACWNVEERGGDHIAVWSYKYTLNGDTIINNVAFSKMYSSYTGSLVGFIREDSTNKIYFKSSYPNNFERLIFDFNVDVGDSVKIRVSDFDTSIYMELTISNIDTFLFKGKYSSSS